MEGRTRRNHEKVHPGPPAWVIDRKKRITTIIKSGSVKLTGVFSICAAWGKIENDKDYEKRHRIVGYEELIGTKDYISMDSPIANGFSTEVKFNQNDYWRQMINSNK